MSASNVRYSGQMESSYEEEWLGAADETTGSYINFDQEQFHAPSFQTSLMSDPGIAEYPQQQSQIIYCDVCRVSCVGLQSYANHLNGEKHKKKEAPSQVIYCEICRVSSNDPQSYAKHLNGQKHKKREASQALQQKSHQCPKPDNSAANRHCCELCDVTCTTADLLAAHVRGAKHLRVLNLRAMMEKSMPTVTTLQASQPSTTPDSTPTSAAAASIPPSDSTFPAPASALVLTADAAEEVGSETAADASDVVGQEFIGEVKNEEGLVVSFYCRLCKCSSIDPNGKRVHLEGRRHRQEYKEKIDSTIEMPQRRNTPFDQHVIQKHMDIYPPKEEMAEIHIAISEFENALKLVSDVIAAEDAPSKTMDPAKASEETAGAEKTAAKVATDELGQEAEKEMIETTATEAADCEARRLIKGAMRVGLLSKGLLLRWDSLAEHLVIICAEKPTRSLLQRIVDHLPAQLEIVSPMKKFQIEMRVEEAGLFVTIEEPIASFVVTLTSMLVVEDPEPVDPPPSASSDELSPGHCLSALVLLRRTKWFQIRLCATMAGTVVVHVLRDFCRRNVTWTSLSEWAQVLLVEKSIFAAGIDIKPAEALRSFLECIASGILLAGGHGLMDPCEKVPTDVTAYLTEQQCEDITVSAQQFLRLFLFGQLYKFLDVAKFKLSQLRRRKRDHQDDKPDERADDKKPKREDPAVKGNDAESENGDGDLVTDIDYNGNLVIVID